MQKKIKVKPSSKFQGIKEEADGSLTVNLKSPRVDGTNAELIKLLAETFKAAKVNVRIKHGLTSRQKIVEITLNS